MDRTTLAINARKHWEQLLPQKVKGLEEAEEYGAALQAAARLAQKEIANMMAQGYQEHEAEEVVLPLFILLKPEPAGDDQESRDAATAVTPPPDLTSGVPLSLRWPDGSALCVTATGICLTERKERYWVSTCPTPLSLVEQKRTPDAP